MHKWQKLYLRHSKNYLFPFKSAEEFYEWLESYNYDPKEGDRVIMYAHRTKGFIPHVAKGFERPYQNVEPPPPPPERPPLDDELAAPQGEVTAFVWKMWRWIISACYDERASDYPSYGGKGIEVDREWWSYERFLYWIKQELGARFRGNLSDAEIRRLSRSKGFTPDNCYLAIVEVRPANPGKFNARRWKKDREIAEQKARRERRRRRKKTRGLHW